MSPHSPASKAGLRSGDIVTRLNGQPMKSATQLRNLVASLPAGNRARMTLFREGQVREVEVTIGNREDSPEQLARSAPQAQSSDELGLSVQTLTAERARQLGYNDGAVRGVEVTQVGPTGLASRVGINKGDVIVAVGDTPVRDAAGFQAAIGPQDLRRGIRLQIIRDGIRRFVFIKSVR